MSAIDWLKQSAVVRAGATYAAGAWIALQVADTLLPAFGAPDWVMPVVSITLILGFPLVLIMAWVVSRRPVSASPEVAADEARSGREFDTVLLSLIALAVMFLFVDRFFLDLGSRGGPPAEGAAVPAAKTQRFALPLGPVASIRHGLTSYPSISADGTTIVYSANVDGTTRLYGRRLDDLSVFAIPGSDGAYFPVVSPDGSEVLAESESGWKRMTIPDGALRDFPHVESDGGASWGERLLMSIQDEQGAFSIYALGKTNQEMELLLPGKPATDYFDPDVIPGTNAVLLNQEQDRPGGTRYTIALLDGQGQVTELLEDAFGGRYVPGGYISFVRNGILWATAFDPETLTLRGRPVEVIRDIEVISGGGYAFYGISATGTLVYVRGTDISNQGKSQLVWVNRDGSTETAISELRRFSQARLSPDGRQVAVVVEESGNKDIWVYDLDTSNALRLTFDAAQDESPTWSPDGTRIAFSSSRDRGGIWWKLANGAGSAERLTQSELAQYPEVFTPDGSGLVYREERQRSDLYLLALDSRTTVPLFASEVDEDYASISPDGRWLVYEGDEIYVHRFPDVASGKWQISRGEGDEPLWSPTGNEIFFRADEESQVLVVPVDVSAGFQAQAPRPLLRMRSSRDEPTYSVSPDGQRFLVVQAVGDTAVPFERQLVVVLDWPAELARLVNRD